MGCPYDPSYHSFQVGGARRFGVAKGGERGGGDDLLVQPRNGGAAVEEARAPRVEARARRARPSRLLLERIHGRDIMAQTRTLGLEPKAGAIGETDPY